MWLAMNRILSENDIEGLNGTCTRDKGHAAYICFGVDGRALNLLKSHSLKVPSTQILEFGSMHCHSSITTAISEH